jgi:hypothetical protein
VAVQSYGTKGEPQFSDLAAPDIGVDPGEAAKYAGIVGNRVSDTNAKRIAGTIPGLSGKTPWVGLEWHETDTGLTYLRTASGWVLTGAYPKPSVRVRTTTAQATSGTLGASKPVVWDVEDHATVSSVHSTTTNTSRFVAPIAGLYTVKATLSNASTSFAIGVGFSKNGTPVAGTKTWCPPSAATFGIATAATDVLLNAGDYIEVVSYGGAASLSLTVADCSASFTWLGN